jgi:hypothetical protein
MPIELEEAYINEPYKLIIELIKSDHVSYYNNDPVKSEAYFKANYTQAQGQSIYI